MEIRSRESRGSNCKRKGETVRAIPRTQKRGKKD